MTRVARLTAVTVGLAAFTALPSAASAFRLVAAYDDPATAGGGEGRRFTGSVRDGYTCAVCHEGSGPVLDVRGLPEDGYVPGGSYELVVDLPAVAVVASLTLELTDERGDGAGVLELPDPAALTGEELCDPVAGQPAEVAAAVSLHEGARTVAATDGCGANRLRVTWLVPDDPVGTVWLNAAAVAADGSGDPTGDTTSALARAIPLRGEGAVAASVGSGCSAAGGLPAGSPLSWVVVLWLVAVVRAAGGGTTSRA